MKIGTNVPLGKGNHLKKFHAKTSITGAVSTHGTHSDVFLGHPVSKTHVRTETSLSVQIWKKSQRIVISLLFKKLSE